MASSDELSTSEIAIDPNKDVYTTEELVSFGQSDSNNFSNFSIENNIDCSQKSRLLPPPLASFSSYKSLQETIRSWTKDQGYDLVVSRSYKHNSKIVRRYLECGRAGKSQNKRNLSENDRIRKTSTHKIGCPMGLYVVADNRENPEGTWSIRYKATKQSQNHNHGPEFGIANHRRHERNNNLLSEIQRYVDAGITPAQTIIILRKKFPNLLQTSQDVRNIKSRFRKVALQPKNPTETL
ncbi:putative mutator-like element protein [Erysiphe neolycopersici]|uniref:Putative mutator-like element protein n=1 Tax=Erysiphe neolycopersici TaxID=212602 RepID=A0A420HK21_9PEZI|nr:putative mutator-like element protein [Erysiphe neolycopersici]